MYRLGAVSFLNSRPLIHGLQADPRFELVYDVPAALPALLDAGRVDAALVPIVDVIRSGGRLQVVSDACIASDGETMTVRVFSRVPPDRVESLWVDADSHTSIALATVMWYELYGRCPQLTPLPSSRQIPPDAASVLLIGDKVVQNRRRDFAYEVDLGAAWREHTGRPFVFAVWAARMRPAGGPAGAAAESLEELGRLLGEARDAGVLHAAEIADSEGPKRWWPPAQARHYLMHCLKFRLDERFVDGANQFARLCGQYGLAPAGAAIRWPASLVPSAAA